MKEAGSNVLELVKSTPNQEIVKMVKSYMDNHTKLAETIEHTNIVAENDHEVTKIGEVYSE